MILAFETAVSGGSVALVDELGQEVLSFIGSAGATLKGENILPQIQEVLSASGAGKRDLTTIVTSAGPGSFTGIRVGIATAIGLARSLRIPVSVQPLLPSMMMRDEKDGYACVPVGHGGAACQEFETGRPAGAAVNVEGTLSALQPNRRLILHHDLYQAVDREHKKDAGSNMALLLARRSISFGQSLHEPIFLSRTA